MYERDAALLVGQLLATYQQQVDLAGCPLDDQRGRDFFIHNLLVRIHVVIEMILVDRPCAMGVWIPVSM